MSYITENPLSKTCMCVCVCVCKYMHAPIEYLEHSTFLTAQKNQVKRRVSEYSSKAFLNY